MDSRKSSFGYLFLLGGGTIPWKSEKQFAMATSTMEAEFMAYFEATVQALCLQNFVLSLGIVNRIAKPLKIYCENFVVVFLFKNDKRESFIEHIGTDDNRSIN